MFNWDFVSDALLTPSRIRGSETGEIQGWYSPATRERVPIAVLLFEGSITPPALIATAIFAEGVTGRLTRETEALIVEADGDRLALSTDLAAGRSTLMAVAR